MIRTIQLLIISLLFFSVALPSPHRARKTKKLKFFARTRSTKPFKDETHSEVFRCKISKCTYTNTDPYKVTEHYGEMHLKEDEPFPCGICNGTHGDIKTFSKISSLKEHMMRHAKEYLFKCDLCSRKYVHRANFNLHVKTCEKKYAARQPLKKEEIAAAASPQPTLKASESDEDTDTDDEFLEAWHAQQAILQQAALHKAALEKEKELSYDFLLEEYRKGHDTIRWLQ